MMQLEESRASVVPLSGGSREEAWFPTRRRQFLFMTITVNQPSKRRTVFHVLNHPLETYGSATQSLSQEIAVA